MCLVILFYFHLELGINQKGFVCIKENRCGRGGPPWIFLLKIPKMKGTTLIVVKNSKNKGDHR